METQNIDRVDFDESRRVRRFKGGAQAVAFPLGGIGTGNVSVGARGELRDWEIFNRPAKGNHMPYGFFAIRAQQEGRKAVTKVLESKINPPHTGATGYPAVDLAGLPRLDSSILEGKYPFVSVEFEDSQLPVKVSMEAFTPLIPLNSDDSGIPGAVIRYRVKNTSTSATTVSILKPPSLITRMSNTPLSLMMKRGWSSVPGPRAVDPVYLLFMPMKFGQEWNTRWPPI